jgi:hypothetical protein
MCKNGNGQSCWDLNPNCQAKKCGQSELVKFCCLAKEEEKICWQVDWASAVKNLSESERGFWKGFYCVGCQDCPLYEIYQGQIEQMIDDVNKV